MLSTQKMKKRNLINLLVLTGMVSLAKSQGTEVSKLAVEVNSKFAFDCYRQLAKEGGDENLFFSPYSISNALMMLGEGARRETALEMGKVLGFSESLLRYEKDAREIPWDFRKVRAGLAGLNRSIVEREGLAAEQVKLRETEGRMQKRLDALDPAIAKAEKSDDTEKVFSLGRERWELGGKLYDLSLMFDSTTLRVANAVWGDRSAQFYEPWKKAMRDSYGVEVVQEADFKKNSEDERRRVNAWVKEQTKDRIKELFPKGSLNAETRLVVANAIYFKGDWMEPFLKKDTKEGEFQLEKGGQIKVPLMSKMDDDTVSYAAFESDGIFFETPEMVPYEKKWPETYPGADGFAMVDMPYRGDRVSMVIIAPNDPKGLPELEKKLTRANVTKWITSLKKREANITLPRFKVETQYDLKAALSAMGMARAFDPEDADFGGISSSGNLFLGKVIHKAIIEVSEEGTEAAATTWGGASGGIPKEVPFTPSFKADRPFVYLIRDKKSGSILFLGRVLDPTR